MGARAFLGLGSNLGDRLGNLQRAVDFLSATNRVRVMRSSRVYETDPVGGVEQPDFLNAVIEVETDLSARDLLATCAGVEEALERVREVRWGPRTIDVDLLVYNELEIDEPDLVLPHPRMHERAFVMLPLLELEPDPMLPGGRRAGNASPEGSARPFAPPLAQSAPPAR